jgi:hypothetical protein
VKYFAGDLGGDMSNKSSASLSGVVPLKTRLFAWGIDRGGVFSGRKGCPSDVLKDGRFVWLVFMLLLLLSIGVVSGVVSVVSGEVRGTAMAGLGAWLPRLRLGIEMGFGLMRMPLPPNPLGLTAPLKLRPAVAWRSFGLDSVELGVLWPERIGGVVGMGAGVDIPVFDCWSGILNPTLEEGPCEAPELLLVSTRLSAWSEAEWLSFWFESLEWMLVWDEWVDRAGW